MILDKHQGSKRWAQIKGDDGDTEKGSQEERDWSY